MTIETELPAVKVSELKPCPFCGGAPSLESLVTESMIRCESCGARVDASIHPGVYTTHDAMKRAEDQSVKKLWNTRTPAESRCEELVEALEQAKKRMRNCRGAIESNQVVDKDVHGSLTRGIADIDAALKELGKGDGR